MSQLGQRQKNIQLGFLYLAVVLEGLGLVPLAIMQRSQFGQCLGVSGSYTDDLHHPLDCLLGIFQKLIDEANESRTNRCSHESLHEHLPSNICCGITV